MTEAPKTPPGGSDKSAKSLSEAQELLADLEQWGVELQAQGERLLFRPRNAMTPDLLQRLTVHKANLLALLSGGTASVPSWDPEEASRLLTELRDEVGQLRQHFGGTFPEPLAAVVGHYLSIAEGYVSNHKAEALRGWNSLALLRDVRPRIAAIAQAWNASNRVRI
jgi:hypothetical protein